jgi:hypothetical protein
VGVPEGRSVDTKASLDTFVPVEWDWSALDDCCQGKSEHGGNDGYVDSPANLLKPRKCKYVDVEEEKGYFGQRDQDLVRNLINIEILQQLASQLAIEF